MKELNPQSRGLARNPDIRRLEKRILRMEERLLALHNDVGELKEDFRGVRPDLFIGKERDATVKGPATNWTRHPGFGVFDHLPRNGS